jgi:hypothetical protein
MMKDLLSDEKPIPVFELDVTIDVFNEHIDRTEEIVQFSLRQNLALKRVSLLQDQFKRLDYLSALQLISSEFRCKLNFVSLGLWGMRIMINCIYIQLRIEDIRQIQLMMFKMIQPLSCPHESTTLRLHHCHQRLHQRLH